MANMGPQNDHIVIQALDGSGRFGVVGDGSHAKLVSYDEKGNISKTFNVKIGGEKNSSRDVLEKLATLLNTHVPKVEIQVGDKLLVKSKGIRHITADKKTKFDFKTEEYKAAFKEVSGSLKTAVKADILGSSILLPSHAAKKPTASSSRYDLVSLAERLVQKYKDPQKVLAAINGLRQCDMRFNQKYKDFAIGPEFDDLIDALKAKIPPGVEFKQTEKEHAAMQKLQKQVATELVGLCIRKEVEAPVLQDGTYMCQASGHVEADGKFAADGKTISSLLQKEEKDVVEIANHAVITLKNQHGEPSEVVLSRSARTDTAQKILDKSRADIQSRLESTTQNGLKKIVSEDGSYYYEYQRVDVTLMDTNILKSLATTLRSGLRNLKAAVSGKKTSPIENERAFVRNKKRAVEEVWEGKSAKVDDAGRRYIEHTINGEKVREYQPQVVNFVFSGQANKPENVARARQENIGPAAVLFEAILKESDLSQKQKYLEVLAIKDTRVRNKQLASSIKNDIGTLADSNLKSACRAMLVMLTGMDENEHSYDNADGSDQQFLLFALLAEMAGAALSVECKSGNDRSLTAVSLACSAKEWSKEHGGELYDPTLHPAGLPEYAAFQNGFNKYAEAFGPQNLLAARGPGDNGKPDLKTGKSPVFMKYAQGLDTTFNILGVKNSQKGPGVGC